MSHSGWKRWHFRATALNNDTKVAEDGLDGEVNARTREEAYALAWKEAARYFYPRYNILKMVSIRKANGL